MVRGRILWVAVAVSVLSLALVGIGPSADAPVPGAVSEADASVHEGTPTPAPAPSIPDRKTVPDGGRAQAAKDEVVTPWDLTPGSLIMNPASGRMETIDPGVAGQAVLFGDSQSAGAQGVQAAQTWVEMGLSSQGYKVNFMGHGGIGFVAKTSTAANYPEALESGKVKVPFGNPALVVVQGGGNDAGSGATDAQIVANAGRLLRDLMASYPTSEFLMIGTLGRGGAAGGGRRGQVDSVLAGFAKSNGIPFISPRDWLTRYGVSNKMADGVHLTAGGHQELAKVLASELKTLGLQAPALTR